VLDLQVTSQSPILLRVLAPDGTELAHADTEKQIRNLQLSSDGLYTIELRSAQPDAIYQLLVN
jgi:hypothetical protein